MKRLVAFVAVAAPLLATGPGTAQDRWSLEVRGGTAMATADVAGSDLGPGLGFEGTVGYRFMPHLSAYAGWDWMRFPTEATPEGADFDVEETGYAFGLQFEHPFRAGAGSSLLRFRLGGTYNHIELEEGGEITADSGHGLGWEAGTGFIVPMGDRWRLTPGLRYRALARDLTVASVNTPVDLTYLAVEFGVSRRF